MAALQLSRDPRTVSNIAVKNAKNHGGCSDLTTLKMYDLFRSKSRENPSKLIRQADQAQRGSDAPLLRTSLYFWSMPLAEKPHI